MCSWLFPPNQHNIIDSADTAPAPSTDKMLGVKFQAASPPRMPPGQARSVLLIKWLPFTLDQALYHQYIFYFGIELALF